MAPPPDNQPVNDFEKAQGFDTEGDKRRYLENLRNSPDLGSATRLFVQPANNLFGGVFDPVGYGQFMAGRDAAHYGGNPSALAQYNQGMQGNLLDAAQRRQATNPYNAQLADQTRGAQMALMNQMRMQQGGPSIAQMQGQRALGQSGNQALMASALGGGRGAMLGAQQAGSAMGGDVAQARLAELMRSQAGIGGIAGGLRGNDLKSAEQQQQMGLKAQGLADQNARFNAQQGMSLYDGTRNAQLEYYKLLKRMQAQRQQEAAANQQGAMKAIGTVAGMV